MSIAQRSSSATPLQVLVAGYCLVMWGLTERATRWGRLIEEWRAEYFGADGKAHGSMKFRTEEGQKFIDLALPWSLLVYPLAAAGIFLAVRRIQQTRSASGNRVCVLLALVLALILVRFVWLGVLNCVISSM